MENSPAVVKVIVLAPTMRYVVRATIVACATVSACKVVSKAFDNVLKSQAKKNADTEE